MMRTKHLLVSAMALPLLFTACTQDELVSENGSSPALANRKTVENVTINMTEPSTRMAFGNGYEWVAGDQFGACLMDEYQDRNTTGSWWEDFTLVDYIQTNYPFTRQESANWTSEAVMQEGNYFFYFPYNYNLGGKRTPIRLTVPTEQYVKDGEATSTVLNNQLFLAYSPIIAEEGKEKEVLDLTMQPVLAFPAFNLKNVGTGSLKVKRIAFAADGKQWPGEYELKATNFAGADGKFEKMDDKAQRAALVGQLSSVTEKEASKVVVTFGEEGIELSSQEAMWAYIMLPPSTNLSNPKLYIYTDKGLGIADLSVPHTDAGTTAKNITNDRALTSFDYNDGAAVYITFDNTAMDQPFDMEMSSTSDLEDLVEWSKNNTDATLTATVAGDQVEITKKIYDILEANKNMVLNLTSISPATVTIPADAPVNALDRINVLENNQITLVNKADVTIAADLDHDGGQSVYDAPKVLVNEGNISFNSADHHLSGTEFVNNGTVVLNKKGLTLYGIGNHQFKNNGTMIVAANATVSDAPTYGGYGIDNYGTLTLNEGIELNGRIDNKKVEYECMGTINVNGAWKAAKGTNEGIIIVSETGSIVATSLENTAVKLHNQKGDVIKEAVIENSGAVNNVKNNGTIKMMTASARLVTESSSTGDIDNTEGSNYVTKQNNETVFCVVTEAVTAAELNGIVKDANAKRLDISGTITISNDDKVTDVTVEVEEVNVTGDLKIDGADKTLRFVNGTTGTIRNISTGTTELTARSVLSLGALNKCDGTVNLADDATLIIANNASLYGIQGTIGGMVENYGKWYWLDGGNWKEY